MNKTTLSSVLLATLLISACNQSSDKNSKPPIQTKKEPEIKTCHVKAEAGQGGRVSLDLWAHAKDAMNAQEFVLPTSCDKMNTLKQGQKLIDKFRTGSLFMEGSISSWRLIVKNIPKIENPDDKTSCKVQLALSESRISLDLTKHVKDAINKNAFDWEVPCSVHKQLNIGDDLIKDGWRTGSIIFKQSLSNWNLNVTKKYKPTSP